MIPRDKTKSLGKLEMRWKLGADEGDRQVTDMSRLVMAVYEAEWVGVRMSKQVMSRMGKL